MLQNVNDISFPEPGAGVVTYANILALKPGQTPNAMNVKFLVGGAVEKRLGSSTINATVLVSSAATGFAPDSNATLGTSLLSYWKMDEQASTRIDFKDGNNLASFAGVPFAVGILGNAALFTASSSQYLEASTPTGLDSGAINFTIAFWAMLNSKPANRMAVVGKGVDASGGANTEWFVEWDNTTDQFRFQGFGGGGFAVSSNVVSVTTSTWHFIVAWKDSTNGLVYISVSNATALSASYTGVANSTVGPFSVGRPAGGDLRYWDGRIDEIGYWNKTLTAQERTDLYNTGIGNSYDPNRSNSGWGMFDFGAGFSSGIPLRWLVVSAGTGVYASSNRGQTFVVIGTDRGADYQEFERSKNQLFAFSNTYNRVLYWAGSVGTFMLGMPVGSAPAAKHGVDFAGYLLMMNDSSGRRIVTYAPNNSVLTDAWNNTFEIPSSYDDEITGAILLDRSCYAFTKYSVSRISAIGGNPDFGVQKVKGWGAVPRTIKKVTLPLMPWIGEVTISLGWDRKIRIFDGTFDRVISNEIEQDNGMFPAPLSKINLNAIQKSVAEVDDRDQTYRLWVAIEPSSNVTHMIGLNLRTFGWYASDNQGFTAVVAADSGNFRNLFGVNSSGFVHQLDTSNTDAGKAIADYYDSLMLTGKTPKSVTKSHQINLYFSATSSGNMFFQDRRNFASAFEDPPRSQIVLSDTTNNFLIRWSVDIPTTQNVLEWRISSSGSTANPWRMIRADYSVSDMGEGEG